MKLQGQKDLLIALSHAKDITVWEHVFTPKEYIVSHLEEFFSKYAYNANILCFGRFRLVIFIENGPFRKILPAK